MDIKSEPITVRLTPPVTEEVKAVARERSCSQAAVIRSVLEQWRADRGRHHGEAVIGGH
jgi:Arc/MetJ-type ribon-helix-helix transcriptional regulator